MQCTWLHFGSRARGTHEPIRARGRCLGFACPKIERCTTIRRSTPCSQERFRLQNEYPLFIQVFSGKLVRLDKKDRGSFLSPFWFEKDTPCICDIPLPVRPKAPRQHDAKVLPVQSFPRLIYKCRRNHDIEAKQKGAGDVHYAALI